MSKKKVIVAKLSGSLFFSDKFDEFAKTVKKILKEEKELHLVLVAGGGAGARKYIEAAKMVGADQATLDEIGIEVSRLNARVLASSLSGLAYPLVPRGLAEVVSAVEVEGSRLVIVGGFHPGQSTNAVGALISEKLRANHFYNLTDVDGVYTKDPRTSKDAKKLDTVTVCKLSQILGNESMKAGGYDLMDMVALKLLQRSNVPTTIMHCDPKTLESALLSKKRGIGTRIITDSSKESK